VLSTLNPDVLIFTASLIGGVLIAKGAMKMTANRKAAAQAA
jgi:hypothetical protein